MSGEEGKDRQSCILLLGILNSGFLFSLLSATILMYSFGFENWMPGNGLLVSTRWRAALFWHGLAKPDSVCV